MTNEEKAARLEGWAAKKDFAAEHAKSAVFGGGTWVAEFTADAALLREAAELMREQEGKLLLTERDWKGMYEAQERDMAALRKRVGELEADLATAGSNVHTLRDELREAQQQMAADAMLIAEAQRGAEIVADTERRLERRIAELEAERDAAKAGAGVWQEAVYVKDKQLTEFMDWQDRFLRDLELARAGEARAVEALKAARERCDWWHSDDCPWAGPRNTCTCEYRQLVQEVALILSSAQPALDWLAQQRREAAARELEQLMESEWKWEEFGLKAGIHARIGALTTQQPTACSRSEVRGKERL